MKNPFYWHIAKDGYWRFGDYWITDFLGGLVHAIGFIFLTVLLMRSIKIVDPEREVCALSVTHRSSFNLGFVGEPGREYIPLNCKTQKLCLQSSDDNCATTGVISTPKNKVTNIKLSDKEREVQIEILDVVSDAMYRCHDMLGKGKLNFMPHSLWDTNYCVIFYEKLTWIAIKGFFAVNKPIYYL